LAFGFGATEVIFIYTRHCEERHPRCADGGRSNLVLFNTNVGFGCFSNRRLLRAFGRRFRHRNDGWLLGLALTKSFFRPCFLPWCLTAIFGAMIAWILGVLWMVHPIHVSITEISYNTTAKAVQITVRLFIDDLETAIRQQTRQPELDLLAPPTTTDALVTAYLKDRFQVTLDGKQQKWNYLGHEQEGPALIAYIEIEKARKFKAIEVHNSCMHEIYDDQNNIVNVNYQQTVKSLRLTTDQQSGKLVFAN
jgi:hypothetical protein